MSEPARRLLARRAERLGALPRREGVGREALVEQGEGHGVVVAGEVEVEVGQGLGGDEALVHDRAERARRRVGAGELGADPAPEPVGGALASGVAAASRAVPPVRRRPGG